MAFVILSIIKHKDNEINTIEKYSNYCTQVLIKHNYLARKNAFRIHNPKTIIKI